MIRATYTFLTALALGISLLCSQEALAQQPAKPTEVVVPNAPGGKAVVVPRDQLRVSAGTKTARLTRPMRAALDSKDSPAVPKSWDWTKDKNGKQASLPMYGNDQYGDCYYVAPAKFFILCQWTNNKGQLTYDKSKLINRYLQLSHGDNGLDDGVVFPEIKGGIVGPNGPHKALDVLVVPATDKAALDLTGWCFGPHMFTFTVYSNFTQVSSNQLMTGNQGRVVGGHAILFSGKDADGNRIGETWGIQPGFRAAPSWIAGVDPEFISVFSTEWFDDKGYAPNGLHYTVLAPIWNSLGGHVPVPGPFPAPVNPEPSPVPVPVPTPTPVPVPTPTPTPVPTQGFTGSLNYVNGVLVSVGPAKSAPTLEEIKGIVDAKIKMAFPGIQKIGDANLNQLIEDIAAAVWNWFTHRNDASAPKKVGRFEEGEVGEVSFPINRSSPLILNGYSTTDSVWIGAGYPNASFTFDGKPVTRDDLVFKLAAARSKVTYTGKPNAMYYGVHTSGAFTTTPVLKP